MDQIEESRADADEAAGAAAHLGEAIDRRTVKELVADKILSLIASGIIRVGEQLPGERELAAMLRVSRETVRGAIQRLAALGVVEVAQGLRSRVISADITPKRIGFAGAHAVNAYDIEAVQSTRLLVERELVRACARRIDAAGIARLEAGLDEQADVAGDPVGFLICDREFHTAIYRAGGNALLADIAADLYAHMLDRRRVVVSAPGAIRRSIAEHRAIVEALKGHDEDAAAAAFARHTERIMQTTRAVLPGADGNGT